MFDDILGKPQNKKKIIELKQEAMIVDEDIINELIKQAKQSSSRTSSDGSSTSASSDDNPCKNCGNTIEDCDCDEEEYTSCNGSGTCGNKCNCEKDKEDLNECKDDCCDCDDDGCPGCLRSKILIHSNNKGLENKC